MVDNEAIYDICRRNLDLPRFVVRLMHLRTRLLVIVQRTRTSTASSRKLLAALRRRCASMARLMWT